jgi:hypothetical protein
MIAKILLTGLLTFFLSGGIVAIKGDRVQSNENDAVEQRDYVKAIEHNGEILPWIELPVVEITAEFPTDDLVKAIKVDGEYFPSYELDEVVITPGA